MNQDWCILGFIVILLCASEGISEAPRLHVHRQWDIGTRRGIGTGKNTSRYLYSTRIDWRVNKRQDKSMCSGNCMKIHIWHIKIIICICGNVIYLAHLPHTQKGDLAHLPDTHKKEWIVSCYAGYQNMEITQSKCSADIQNKKIQAIFLYPPQKGQCHWTILGTRS